MQRIKNKKRLTGLVIAFLLVFVTGSAFALTPGMLDIVGTVNLQAPGYVVWHSVAETLEQNPVNPIVPPPAPLPGGIGIEPLGSPIGAMQTAAIVDRPLPGPNETDQRIVWDMYFANIGFISGVNTHRARLTATARNDSNMAAVIASANVSWDDGAGTALDPTDFGLTVVVDQSDFSGAGNPLAAGAISDELIVTVYWDGTTPTGFGPGTTNPITGLPHAFAARLIITFDYAPL